MNSLELFAGAGGLGLGLHAAGFRPVGVIECDSYCCNTIRENKQRGMEGVKEALRRGVIREPDGGV
jgi:DNA (cytosine-5)-methyltransferase 1